VRNRITESEAIRSGIRLATLDRVLDYRHHYYNELNERWWDRTELLTILALIEMKDTRPSDAGKEVLQ
jgi:hypothetical protein